jgi:hypothetical protein
VNRKFVAEIRTVMPVKTGIQATENAPDSGVRGCVKTHRQNDFGGLLTITRCQKTQYSAS